LKRRSLRNALLPVCLGVMIFLSGYYASTLMGNMNGPSDRIGIKGQVLIQAYHSNGKLFAVWQGHNSILTEVPNDIVGCLSGSTSTPAYFGRCTGWSTSLYIEGCPGAVASCPALSSEPVISKPGTIGLLPAGCNLHDATFTNLCKQWSIQASFSSELTTPQTWFAAGTLPNSATFSSTVGACAIPPGCPLSGSFDYASLGSPITTNAGDTLTVTITFTPS
jgi:hypothetical protein